MLNKMTSGLDFQGTALMLRSDRQRMLASNIANVDTPGYAGRDINFAAALRDITEQQATQKGGSSGGVYSTSALGTSTLGTSNARHIPVASTGSQTNPDSRLAALTGYTVQTQPSMDNNSVDLDRERANFVDNSVRYEATLRFINGYSKTMLSAIQGQ